MTGETGSGGGSGAGAARGQYNLASVFTYRTPRPDQVHKFEAIVGVAKELATTILNNTPPNPKQALAIQNLEATCWAAMAAITEGG